MPLRLSIGPQSAADWAQARQTVAVEMLAPLLVPPRSRALPASSGPVWIPDEGPVRRVLESAIRAAAKYETSPRTGSTTTVALRLVVPAVPGYQTACNQP